MNLHVQPSDVPPGRRGDQSIIAGNESADSAHPVREPEPPRFERTAFEIHNVSGKMARGIEIELAGFGADDVFRAYYLNRHGAPVVTRTANSLRLRFESHGRAAAQTSLVLTETATRVSRPFMWEFALVGGGGSERFGLEMSTREVIATYRWLVATDATGNTLVAESNPAFVHDSRTRIAWTHESMQRAE